MMMLMTRKEGKEDNGDVAGKERQQKDIASVSSADYMYVPYGLDIYAEDLNNNRSDFTLRVDLLLLKHDRSIHYIFDSSSCSGQRQG